MMNSTDTLVTLVTNREYFGDVYFYFVYLSCVYVIRNFLLSSLAPTLAALLMVSIYLSSHGSRFNLRACKFEVYISWGSMPPDPPTLWHALHAIPHPLGKFGRTCFFLLPMALHILLVLAAKLWTVLLTEKTECIHCCMSK